MTNAKHKIKWEGFGANEPATNYKKRKCSWVWPCTSAIPAPRRMRQEDLEFQASLGYTVTSYLKRKKKKT
jgi:hypothetical protein